MPQLAVETYPSQVFWVLIGFLCVYLFISRVAVPSLQEILKVRSDHIGSILTAAEQLKSEAEEIEKNSQIALENAQLSLSAAESKLMSDFREECIARKNEFYERFSRESAERSQSLSDAANDAFEAISKSSDAIVDAALKAISERSDAN